MDAMGYDYVAFGDFHFKDDLQYQDAISRMRRLLELAGSHGLEFGVKNYQYIPCGRDKKCSFPARKCRSGRSLIHVDCPGGKTVGGI